MTPRTIALALIILAALGGAVYWRQRDSGEELKVPEAQTSVEESLEDKFKIEIPDDADKTELKDTGGGNSSGIFTKKFENNRFTSSFIVDLPAPTTGEHYEAWIEKGTKGAADYSIVPAGRLTSGKGGYLLNFNSNTDYSSYNKVLITREKVADRTPETTVLEGSFN